MKWIGRKPSLRVHVAALTTSLIVLFAVGVWVSSPPRYFGSAIGRLIRANTFRKVDPFYTPQMARCYVTIEGERARIVEPTFELSDAFWNEHGDHYFMYVREIELEGILSPRYVRVEHRFVKLTNPKRPLDLHFHPHKASWGYESLADDEGYLAIDPRAVQRHLLIESRAIRSGMVVDLIALFAALGMLWSIAWMPRQLRHLVRRKRYRRGLCPLCRYDLSATPGQCPECGWGS